MEALVPVGLVALFPVIEWVIHVHPALAPAPIRPRRGRLAARAQHRAHHADPATSRWCSSVAGAGGLLPSYVVVAWLATPTTTGMFTLLVSVYGIAGLRVDPLPRAQRLPTAVAVVPGRWRNHRLHHYKSEHYWFTVTTAGTADRLFGTYPDPATVQTPHLYGRCTPPRPTEPVRIAA